jgi:hypothetical protein
VSGSCRALRREGNSEGMWKRGLDRPRAGTGSDAERCCIRDASVCAQRERGSGFGGGALNSLAEASSYAVPPNAPGHDTGGLPLVHKYYYRDGSAHSYWRKILNQRPRMCDISSMKSHKYHVYLSRWRWKRNQLPSAGHHRAVSALCSSRRGTSSSIAPSAPRTLTLKDAQTLRRNSL